MRPSLPLSFHVHVLTHIWLMPKSNTRGRRLQQLFFTSIQILTSTESYNTFIHAKSPLGSNRQFLIHLPRHCNVYVRSPYSAQKSAYVSYKSQCQLQIKGKGSIPENQNNLIRKLNRVTIYFKLLSNIFYQEPLHCKCQILTSSKMMASNM